MKVLYETPLRVFAKSSVHSPVEFCDYLFPDETAEDSSQRFCDLIGVDTKGEDIDTETEHMPSKKLCFEVV